jgi:hypothetical protein
VEHPNGLRKVLFQLTKEKAGVLQHHYGRVPSPVAELSGKTGTRDKGL